MVLLPAGIAGAGLLVELGRGAWAATAGFLVELGRTAWARAEGFLVVGRAALAVDAPAGAAVVGVGHFPGLWYLKSAENLKS